MKFCLIVEDNFDEAFLIEKHLSKLGFLTVVTDNTFKAIDMIIAGNVDIIATDINMPVMSGIEMIKYIRTVNSEIPIVALSAYHEYRYKAIEMGANHFIAKPYTDDIIKQIFTQYR